MKDIINSLIRWKDYKGRSTRTQFWNFFAISFLIQAISVLLDPESKNLLLTLVMLILLVPYFAVGIRRMHDVNKSGWYFLIPLYNIYLLTKKGDVVANRFGEPIKNK